ncbi:hypothetical protein AVEN_71714-1 [Araneus ventricosus]|uniref:Uncharacterized protein n=1 Tax=Araneus ventricosus TaxID=182803 RepID=A0A4Y2VLE6_ARAVE|nr:hypothetical protein AVEN_71714-1 [Araneus ventricosus]
MFLVPAQSFRDVARPQIKKSYKEKINKRKSPLIWSPGCTAFTHIYGSPLSERREHIKHLSIEEEHHFSNYWFTNLPPSIGESLALFTLEGSHSAWSQAECLSKKFTSPAPHSESSPALHRASPKIDASTAMHFRIP